MFQSNLKWLLIFAATVALHKILFGATVALHKILFGATPTAGWLVGTVLLQGPDRVLLVNSLNLMDLIFF